MIANPKIFKFDPLLTHFLNDSLANFLPKNGPNFFVCHNETAMTLVVEWNDLRSSIQDLLTSANFVKDVYPMRQDYCVLAYDAKLLIPQAAHCDANEANSYGHNLKHFNFSILIDVGNHTFLDIFPYDTYIPTRILIERGDVIFVRNDIVHRSCENLTDNSHCRIHCFIEPINITRQKRKVVKDDGFDHYPYYGSNTSHFVNPLKGSTLSL